MFAIGAVNTKRARRCIIVIVSIIALLALFAAVGESALLGAHECSCTCGQSGEFCTCGNTCRICLLLSAAADIIRAVAFAAVYLYAVLRVCVAIVRTADGGQALPLCTPVTLRVKLSD